MKTTEKINYIKNQLYSEQKVTISDISKALNISYPTCRKYFKTIAELDPNIEQIHGGLSYEKQNVEFINLYSNRLVKNEKQKKEIASKVLPYIYEKCTVLLDSSTTTLELANALINLDFRFNVITNGISTARLLSKNDKITVIVLPGILSKNSNTIIDEFNFNYSTKFNIDLFIFSATGLTLNEGFSEYNLQEVKAKRNHIEKAKKSIALIDSSKFNVSSSANFAALDEVDLLITDSQLPEAIKDGYGKIINIL